MASGCFKSNLNLDLLPMATPPQMFIPVLPPLKNQTGTDIAIEPVCSLFQGSFDLGKSPIRPVMYSRCLSASGIRFLWRPTPAKDFGKPYGLPTNRMEYSD